MGARWVNAVLVAVACAAGVLWTGIASFLIPAVQALDGRLYDEFYSLRREWTIHLAADVVRIADPGPYSVLGAVIVGIAVARRRLRTAVAVAIVLVGSSVMTQVLKRLTAAERHPFFLPEASWPSGHTTAAAALALCLIIVLPRRLRGVGAAIGAIAIVGMAYSMVLLGSHRPSDVLAGMLVAGLWAASAVAVLEILETRRPPEQADTAPGAIPLLAPVAVVAAAGMAVALLSRSSLVYAYVSDRTMLALGAMLLAAAAFAVASAMALISDT
jgi:membrane-associated phospholipid phosphatase